MNLDTKLNANVGFSRNAYPSKKTINLMMRDRDQMSLKLLIPLAVLGAVLICLFCKFAVIDRLSAAFNASNEANSMEFQLREAKNALEDYDRVAAEYSRYFSDALRSTDMPRTYSEVLDLIEKRLMPGSSVSNMSFSGSVVSLQIVVPRLEDAAGIIEALYTEPAVASVEIYTADNGEDEHKNGGSTRKDGKATVIMTITLKGEDDQ